MSVPGARGRAVIRMLVQCMWGVFGRWDTSERIMKMIGGLR